jgi:hypothetical protein
VKSKCTSNKIFPHSKSEDTEISSYVRNIPLHGEKTVYQNIVYHNIVYQNIVYQNTVYQNIVYQNIVYQNIVY